MKEQPSSGAPAAPIQLSDKRVHVIHDGTLTGEALELETRRLIWLEALMRCIRMLRTAIRAAEWAKHAGPSWNHVDQAFPTPVEGFAIGRDLAHMAAITFLTVFKSGREDKGNVAGNARPAVRNLRDECVQRAFPEASDRAAFDALLERLERARDGLLAHADGSAQEVEHSDRLTSFRPQNEGVTSEDLASLAHCAEKLLEAVKAARAA